MDLSTALNIATTTAVVGGVIFGGWQIRVASRARTTQISLYLIEMLNSLDAGEALIALIALPEGLSWAEMNARLGDQWYKVFMLINVLDGLGILVYRKEVSTQVSDDFFHHMVDEVWCKCRAAILERRRSQGRETSFQFLEWLAGAHTAFRSGREHLGTRAYPLKRSAVAADAGA